MTSAVSLVSQDQPPLAGSEYPAWVLDRYTKLPSNLLQQVRNLGFGVTGGQAAPYDKVNVLEQYLKINFVYNLDVRPPPLIPIECIISCSPLGGGR